MIKVDSTAIVGSKVVLAGENIHIGPFCVLEGEVEIGSNNTFASHVVVKGRTKIGANNTFHPFSCIGNIPQDLKYKGEDSALEIGDFNVFREGVTVNIGTKQGGMLTAIGNHNLFMANSHIGHDTRIANHCVIVNSVAIAGHVIIEDNVLVGGNSAVHQHVRLGRLSVVGGMSGITGDLPPFALAYGDRAMVRSINLVGLKRSGFEKEDMMVILKAYRILYSSLGNFNERLELLKDTFGANKYVVEMLNFINAQSSRLILGGKLEDKIEG
jgi:UDP-N-acetylglucosamine acyltransferase